MISYGGVVLKEPSPQLAAWLLSYMPPSEIFSFYRPRWLGDTDLDPRSHFNWFLRRPVKVNTYYNPWGASRWGIGYFLTDSAGLTAIREQAYANDGYVALPLVMDDDIGGELETDLFMLPPIPLTAAPLDADDPAVQSYLLVLVDERYFWWERSATITVSSATWWADLYSAIGAALGETITTDTISTAYLVPNEELSRSYQYLPLLLDWVAESVGQRIVRTLAGAIVARSATSAADLVDTQVDEYVKIAGGTLPLSDDTQANVPATVSVVFPKIGGGSYALNITLASLTLAGYADQFGRTGKHLIHSTANSQFLSYQTYIAVTANSDSPPPDNAEWLLQDGAAAAYAGGTTYSEGMLVTSSGDTYIYINATPSAGNAPPNATYWTLLPDGVNARGDWVTGAYAVGDSVQAPTNATQLLALAQQIATDFYLWRLASLEIRYRAVVPWVADGMHDVEWLHGMGGIVTVVSRSMWDAGIGRLQHAGAHNTESDNLGGEAIHIFADCTIDAGVVTVVTNSHIPSVIQLTPAPAWSALASFDIDFGRRSFQPTGIVGTNADFVFEDFASRTSSSCVFKTASGTAPEDSFGITIHGIISEPEEGDPADPLNPVDPTTPTIDTDCCDELPNEFCFQFGSLDYSGQIEEVDDEYLALIEGIQVPVTLRFSSPPQQWVGGQILAWNPEWQMQRLPLTLGIVLNCWPIEDPHFGGNFSIIVNRYGTAPLSIVPIYTFQGGDLIVENFHCGPFISITGSVLIYGSQVPLVYEVNTGVRIPFSIVTGPCPYAGPGAPTVTFNDTTIVATDMEVSDTFTIAGTGFDSFLAGRNVVTFNLGLAATCTTATPTLLTMTVTTAPTSAGALVAVVVNANGTSAPAVQVRTVTFPPPITRTTKGVATNSGAQVSTLTKAAVTCEAGLLIVNVAIANNGTGPETITSVTYNGNAMTSAATKSNTGSPLALNLTSCVLTTYYLAVTDETGDIVVTLSGDSWVALEAVNVTGLADNLPDQTVTAKDTLSLPDGDTTGTTTTSDEYVESACFVAIPTDDFWTWNGVTYGSQNVRLNKSFFLDSGYSILSATGTVHATITDIVEAKAWLFVTVTFS